MALVERIAVGVAGWSYPDWDGYVYTGGVGDKLRFVAGYVDVIEINSTFYRPPEARTSASWVRRTADLPTFAFTAKLHQDVTHKGALAPELVRAFREGLGPLLEEGRLKHLLAQFRYDFADNAANREHLSRIRERFGDLTALTLELRHRSWEAPDALTFLTGLGVNVAALDYPAGREAFTLRIPGVGAHAYLRLHGRNRAAWFDRQAGRDQTYNYLYSRAELEGIVARALELAGRSSTLTVVANNHYQGKEMVNALQLKSLLLGRRVPVPPGLVARYPELREYAAN